MYRAWCVGSSSSLTRVKWLKSNGFTPTCKVVWDYTKKFSGSGSVIGLTIRASGIRVNSSGEIESNMVFGNYSGRWYEEFSGAVNTTITTTWKCTAPNGEAYDKVPYEGDYFWISGFVVELDHPSGNSYWGRVTSVSLYWSK